MKDTENIAALRNRLASVYERALDESYEVGARDHHEWAQAQVNRMVAMMLAAPDLLAALEELTAYMGEHGMVPPCRTAAMRLIAKATGKEAAHASR